MPLGVIENRSIDVDYIDQRTERAPCAAKICFRWKGESRRGEDALRRIKLDLVLKCRVGGKWLVKDAIRVITLRLPQHPKAVTRSDS